MFNIMLIAQISDTHLVGKDQHWLSEPSTQTQERLNRVVSYLNESNPRPDAVLLTGDATDLGDSAAYLHLQELLSSLKIPLYAVPGNHDLREGMRKAFSKNSWMPQQGFIHYAINDYPVRLIGLDTLVEGEHFGHLCEERLSWLKQTLAKEVTKPTLLFMHHPPVKTGNKLFDGMICRASSHFEEMIEENEQILGIICGHYHHLCISSFGRKLCLMSPSVSPVHYFAHPDDDQVTALELEDPAVTLHRWHGGKSLTCHVIRVKESICRISWKAIMERRAAK